MGMVYKSLLWGPLLVVNLVATSAAADANPGTLMDAGGSGKDSAFEIVAPPAEQRDAAIGKASTDGVPDVNAFGACLKEGEQCNPLNDKCCGGYYCTGGLVTRCARKL